MSETWKTMTACDLGRGIEYGEINPIDLTEFFLNEIDSHTERESIYARKTAERARAEADDAAARARNGLRASLLDGVPISWKDLFDTAGVLTEAGTALLKGRVPGADARVLKNATERGTVCLGKTHMTELAFSGIGLNPVTATPPNATNPALAPGGSSSGAAVSTALGMAAAGIGSDTGGSVRVPAAWNDLVGHKTTSGYLSLEGVVPLCAGFDTVGPLCRSVEDAAHLTAAMAGHDPVDLTGANLTGKRFLICETVALDDCAPETVEAFEAAVGRMSAAGAKIDIMPIPEAQEALDLSGPLYTVEAYATWKKKIEAAPDLMFPAVRERFRAGGDYSGVEYVQAWQRLTALRQSYLTRTAGVDAVLMPTSPILPPLTQKLFEDEAYFNAQNLLALRNTRIGNLLGLCGLTLPTSKSTCGLMMLAPPFTDGALLRVGAATETVLRAAA